MTLATARKAVTAALVAAVGALGAAMLDGNLATAELVAALGIGLGAGAATYAVPNRPAGVARPSEHGPRRRAAGR